MRAMVGILVVKRGTREGKDVWWLEAGVDAGMFGMDFDELVDGNQEERLNVGHGRFLWWVWGLMKDGLHAPCMDREWMILSGARKNESPKWVHFDTFYESIPMNGVKFLCFLKILITTIKNFTERICSAP